MLPQGDVLSYTARMTQDDVVSHWRKGANDSLEMAVLGQKAGKYALALFHCQLCVEKALKALYIREYDTMPPKTHDLLQLAKKITLRLDEKQRGLLDELTDFVTLARYCDADWEGTTATEEAAKHWIGVAESFLSLLTEL